jgi:hypothetical protein
MYSRMRGLQNKAERWVLRNVSFFMGGGGGRGAVNESRRIMDILSTNIKNSVKY